MPWPLACAVAVVGAWLLPSPVSAQLALPDNFVDDLMVDGLDQPVGLAFLPDGRALVVERLTGKIRLVVNGALAEIDPVITVTGVNTTGLERGLLGIAVDPQWPVRPYLYIHYTSVVGPSVHIQRLTAEGDLAFTGNGSLTINQLSRYNILADIPDQSYQHNGGTVRFGPDGRLYVSIGDDANACQAQTMEILAGKILRLRVSSLPPGGGGPPQRSTITPLDNPFVTNPDSNARLVLHQGLRNPFRFGIDPVTGGLVIGDVGEGNMEELDYVTLPANLEWPIFEGTVVGPTTCPDVDFSRFEAPIYTYDHIEGQAVNGGIVYRRPGSAPHPFPPEYEGDILFCDFYSSWLRRLKNNGLFWGIAVAAGQPDPENWANYGGYISDIVEAPDGSVWYCQMLPTSGSGPGSLHRIRYTGQVSVPSPARAALEFRAPHPSPSNGTVWFDYALDREAEVKLAIYDVAGRLLTRIVAGETRGAGPHRSSWNGRDDRGHDVASGVYVAVLAADGRRIERRFAVAR
jgi:glucose/arabinose dehydrogenase